MLNKSIEVVAIGEELLKGTIANTNGAEISKALFEAGYLPSRHTVLQDEKTSLVQGLKESLNRSRVVITTGGLGPTTDDITRECAATLFNSNFSFNEEIAEDLKKRYGNLPISLKDQATIPSKAKIIKNPLGTASGLIFEDQNSTLILMPGVPHEMRAMLKNDVIPYLQEQFPLSESTYTGSTHFFSLSESAIDPIIRKLQNEIPSITFGIYPGQGVLSVYAMIREKNGHEKNGQKIIEKTLEKLRAEFKDHCFTSTSGKIEEAILELFTKNGWTLSLAESCTGGALASKLTKVSGASNYFLGSIVSYSNELKSKLLNVSEEMIVKEGAVSEKVAIAMAKGVLKNTNSTFSLATTGIAGPGGGSKEKPVGTVWIAILKEGKEPFSKCFHMHGDRVMIIEHTVNAILGELLNYCSQK